MKDFIARRVVPTHYASRRLALVSLSAALMIAFGSLASAAQKHGQFGGQCAEGLAEGQHIATDCSVNWTAKDGKMYCFGNEAAKTKFLKNPQAQLAKARKFEVTSPNKSK